MTLGGKVRAEEGKVLQGTISAQALQNRKRETRKKEKTNEAKEKGGRDRNVNDLPGNHRVDRKSWER